MLTGVERVERAEELPDAEDAARSPYGCQRSRGRCARLRIHAHTKGLVLAGHARGLADGVASLQSVCVRDKVSIAADAKD